MHMLQSPKAYSCKCTTHKYLTLDSILAKRQHGFRSQRSCETLLVEFVHDIINNLDDNDNHLDIPPDLIIIDIDKVLHRKLLHKLDLYGIHKWIN